MLKKIEYYFDRLLEFIVTLCLGAVVVVSFLQVFFRYVLNKPLGWSQEALMILFVYSILFGAALAIKRNEHLQVNIFENMPEFMKKIVKFLEYLVVLIIIIALLYYGTELVISNLKTGQIIGMIPIKKAYVYMAIPISALFMLYYQIKRVFQ